jgi:hypothetical protein
MMVVDDGSGRIDVTKMCENVQMEAQWVQSDNKQQARSSHEVMCIGETELI